MPTLADRPIAIAKEATPAAPPARVVRARLGAPPDAPPEARPTRRPPRLISRFIDGVDALGDRLMPLIFSTGTAQAFE